MSRNNLNYFLLDKHNVIDLIEDLTSFHNFENGLKACIYRGFQRFLKGYPQSYPQLLWISKKSLNIPKLSPQIALSHKFSVRDTNR